MKTRFLLALLITAFTLTGCRGEKAHVEEEGEHEVSQKLVLNAEAIRQSGIEIITATEKSVSDELNVPAEIRADETRVFKINPPVAGRITQDNVMLGDVVRKGQTLALVQNVEVARVHAEFIHELHQNEIDTNQAQTRLKLARQTMEREQSLLDEGISSRKDYLQAQTNVTLAESELRGLKEHAVHIKSEARAILGAYGTGLGKTHGESVQSSSALTTPRSGVVVKKNVSLGAMASPEDSLYEVADLSRVWLDMVIYPNDIERVHLGQTVTFASDAFPGRAFTGSIQYLQPALNEMSQTFVARVFLDNSKQALKPGIMGQATIQLSEGQIHKVFLPEEAVQSVGNERFVFLAQDNNTFVKQPVEVSEKTNAGYFVTKGVKAGDKVAGKGSFTLKAEMLKSQFAEEDH